MRSRDAVISDIAEVFRTHGYDGTSLAEITARTGLGKGSLYHFFPGGKEEMAAAVLDHIDAWFDTHVYVPLRTSEDPVAGIDNMFAAVDGYFHSGCRVCLVGLFALSDARDPFATRIHGYFADWVDALTAALRRAGWKKKKAHLQAEAAVVALQGALVLARSLDDPGVFARTVADWRRRLRDTETS